MLGVIAASAASVLTGGLVAGVVDSGAARTSGGPRTTSTNSTGETSTPSETGSVDIGPVDQSGAAVGGSNGS